MIVSFSNFKKSLSLSIFMLFLFLSAFPLVSQAALVPCGRTGQPVCTLCHLIIGIKGLIDYGFTIMVVVGLAMLVISGVVYIISAGNEGMMTTAKSLMKNVMIGFALILGAVLIVNTVMWVLGAKGTLGITRASVSGWNKFECSASK